MTRDEFVTTLGYRLGNRTDLAAKIIAEMVYVQSTLLEGTGAFTPWFLETEMANVDVPEGEERVPLPGDFLGEIEEQSLWLYDAANSSPFTELHKTAYDRIILKYQTPGTPREYALVGNYILLRPVPNAIFNIRMRYYAKDISVATGNIENAWLKNAADLLMAETGAIMAGDHLQNQALADKFSAAAAIARDRIYKKHESRKHTNRSYGMGED